MGYSDRVLVCLSRATKKEKESIRRELEANIEDHQEALMETGMRASEAWDKAEAAMGDPEEVGKALNAQFSTFWLWAKRVIQVALCLMLIAVVKIYPFSEKAWTGTWEVLVGVWDNVQARQGKDLGWAEGASFLPQTVTVTHSWNCWETMRVGDEMVCLYRVELWPLPEDLEMPGYYAGCFFFCTYNVNLLAPANEELLERLTIIPESKTEDRWNMWRTFFAFDSRGVREEYYQGRLWEGDTYVDVTYDYFGITATMRCPLLWTEVEP